MNSSLEIFTEELGSHLAALGDAEDEPEGTYIVTLHLSKTFIEELHSVLSIISDSTVLFDSGSTEPIINEEVGNA